MRDERLYQVFIGEFVEITTDESVTITSETENGIYNKTKPIIHTGYFLDTSENFVYLGETPNSVTDAIGVRKIFHIAISKPRDKYDDVLEDFDPNEGLAN